MNRDLSPAASSNFTRVSTDARVKRFFTLEEAYWKAVPLNQIDWESFDLAPGARVADLGCGPATVLRHLYRQYPELELIGVDSAIDFLALARSLACEEKAPIKFIEGTAASLTPEALGGPVDLLYVGFAAMCFGELSTVASLFKRLIKPNGRLLLLETDMTSWRVAPAEDEWAGRLEYMLENFAARHGHPLDPRLLLPPLSSCGFGNFEFRAVTQASALTESSRFFNYYESFYPEREQEEAYYYLKALLEDASESNRWGFKQHFILTAQVLNECDA